MKVLVKIVLLAAVLALLPISKLSARSGNDLPVYVFGYGQSFRDSTVYLTSIVSLPGAALDAKTKFLADRESYSSQLQMYLGTRGTEHATCAVFFSAKKSRTEKMYARLRKQIKRDKTLRLVEIPQDGFSFVFVGTSDR